MGRGRWNGKKIMRFMYVKSHVLEVPFSWKKKTGDIPGAGCSDISKPPKIKDPGKFKVLYCVEAPVSFCSMVLSP